MPDRPRYRWRTRLRSRVPRAFTGLVPKGRRSCGGHEWYNADGITDRCYHCQPGERPHQRDRLI